MASKSTLLISLSIIAALAAGPMVIVNAQLGLGGVLGLINIRGTLLCTMDDNVVANTTAIPVFSNALVQLQCGKTVISSATTDLSGVFSILLDPVQFLLSALLNSCNLVVKTPLASCNATLPSIGGLLSPLKFIGSTLLGILNVTNLVPAGFQFLPDIIN